MTWLRLLLKMLFRIRLVVEVLLAAMPMLAAIWERCKKAWSGRSGRRPES